MSSSARIDELRRKFDENPRRYFAPLANEYRKAGDFDQAIFICQEYLPQQPGHMSGHIVFGQALFEAKRLPEAKTVFETALSLDPENLIALRHLADISKDLGDFEAAKTWYERVLQADPRNEEIAAIVASMAASAAPVAPEPAATPVAPTEETPARVAETAAAASAPTVELSAAAVQEMLKARQATQAAQSPPPAPSAALPVPELISLDDAPTTEVRVDDLPTIDKMVAEPEPALEGFESTITEERFDIPSGGMLGLEPTSAAPTAPEPATGVVAGLEALTLDDFSTPAPETPAPASPPTSDTGMMDLGSFELSGDSTPSAASTPPEAVPEPALATTEIALDGDLTPIDFDLEVSAPAAEAATPPTIDSLATMAIDVPEVPIAADMAVEPMPTVVMEAIKLDPPPAAAAAAAAPTAPAMPDLEPEAVAPTQQVDVSKVMEEIKAARKSDASAPAETPAAPTLAASTPAAPFVTETMAQLYLEQGHRTEALDIYRQLVSARPNDATLREKLEALEKQAAEAPPSAATAAVEPPAAATPAGPDTTASRAPAARFATGPTIRDVLRELFGADGTMSSNGSANGIGAEVGSVDLLFSSSPTADAPTPLAVAFDGGYVAATGSIDMVFQPAGR